MVEVFGKGLVMDFVMIETFYTSIQACNEYYSKYWGHDDFVVRLNDAGLCDVFLF